MAAPNLSALLDFEGQFESAAQAILQSSGINAFVSQNAAQLPLINAGVNFDLGAALDELTILPKGGQAAATEQDFFRYTGNLVIQMSVDRDTSRQPDQSGVQTFLAQARALIRAAFMQSQWPFDDTNLPYCRVSQIRPMGTTSGYNQPRNCDLISLRFEITFAIQPSAWPTGFPPS